jgi:protein gp37
VLETKIEWCDSTLNLQAGCDGCELWNPKAGVRKCYAGQIVDRFGGKNKGLPIAFDKPKLFPQRLAELDKWPSLVGVDRPGKPWLNDRPRLVFLDDMGDTFTESLPLDWLAHPAPVCPNGHTPPQVQLVKGSFTCTAAGCMLQWTPFSYLDALRRSPHQFVLLTKRPKRLLEFSNKWELPPNVWPGTSVTNQTTAARLDYLVRVRGGGPIVVSAEPLHGPVDLGRWLSVKVGRRLGWIIAGGESGTAATPCNVQWIRRLVYQAAGAGVACFVKQLGSKPFLHAQGTVEKRGRGFALSVQLMEMQSTWTPADSKGGDPAEWPADLRVRQVPAKWPAVASA